MLNQNGAVRQEQNAVSLHPDPGEVHVQVGVLILREPEPACYRGCEAHAHWLENLPVRFNPGVILDVAQFAYRL